MPYGLRSHLRTIHDFVRIGTDYWLSIYPTAAGELRRCRQRAAAIPDPTLRCLALTALREKRKHAEGAAAFAVLSPRPARRTVVRFLVAFQVMYDYLDTVSEDMGPDVFDSTMRLHTALADALMPGVPYAVAEAAHPHGDDDGYLTTFIQTCRTCCSSLPAFPVVAQTVRSAAALARESQGYNHALPTAPPGFLTDVLAPWASAEGGDAYGLTWWEVVGATGSSLAILVLVAAAADPALEPSESEAIHAVYMPWAGAVLALIDSLVDQERDDDDDTHSLVARYPSPAAAADRVALFASRAIALTRKTGNPDHHALIVAAMIALFASTPEAGAPGVRDAIRSAVHAAGPRARLPLVALRARRALQAWPGSVREIRGRYGRERHRRS